jgi:hypothetical protein
MFIKNKDYTFNQIGEQSVLEELQMKSCDRDDNDFLIGVTTMTLHDADWELKYTFLLTGYSNQSIWTCVYTTESNVSALNAGAGGM